MELRLIRHATLLLTIGQQKILVDPMLSPAGAMTPVPAPNLSWNPLVELPLPVEDILSPDLLLVTHTHRDHWDDRAADMLPKHIPLFCQPPDREKIQNQGFARVHPVGESLAWGSLRLHRTEGRHGTGCLADRLGPVSGYVLESPEEPSLYIVGDTVWCEEVRQAVIRHKPDVIVLNGGGAQFLTGDPITMTAEDIIQVSQEAPAARIVVVHMEAWNHCRLTREDLRRRLHEEGLQHRVFVLQDGEFLFF